MAAISNSLVTARSSSVQLALDSSLKPANLYLGSMCPTKISLSSLRSAKSERRPLVVQASYSDGGRPSSASVFIGGFVLGGLIVGTLGCVYAPQISKALAGADRKELMRKLPKFIYDEEKALEKTRQVLTEKISQLNSAIDEVSTQLRSDNSPNGVAVSSGEAEAVI